MKFKTALISLFFVFGLMEAKAQIVSIASGTDIFITAGTSFCADGITLVPSSNFTLSGANSISRNSTLSSPPGPTYVSRVYLFGATTGNYSGTIQINYADGELNGLTESTLQVNNYTGSAWANHSSATNDVTANFVLSAALTNVQLQELSLAATSAPLPVTWLSFDVFKKTNNTYITWSTAQEINCEKFAVQRSADGRDFTSIHTVAGAGNSSIINAYNYTDISPLLGINYYRIMQLDFDGKVSYSAIKSINFRNKKDDFVILSNPVIGQFLSVDMAIPATLSLFDLSGKLVFENQYVAGLKTIDISHLPKGMYVLRVDNKAMRVMRL